MGVVELSITTTVASTTGEVPLKLDLGEVPRMTVDVIVNRQAAAVQPQPAYQQRHLLAYVVPPLNLISMAPPQLWMQQWH